MGQRHRARELAIQFLYQLDATGDKLELGLENFKEAFGLPKKPAEFFTRLITGVVPNRNDLDAEVQKFAHNWRMDRMSRVDRNILRLATYEFFYCKDIPAKVTINEAVELAKAFGSDESPSFINGILDSMSRTKELKEEE